MKKNGAYGCKLGLSFCLLTTAMLMGCSSGQDSSDDPGTNQKEKGTILAGSRINAKGDNAASFDKLCKNIGLEVGCDLCAAREGFKGYYNDGECDLALVQIGYCKNPDPDCTSQTEFELNTSFINADGLVFESGQQGEDGFLYSYAWDPEKKEEVFVVILPGTGEVTQLASIEKIQSVYVGGALDAKNKAYYFLGADEEGKTYVVKVDYTGGNKEIKGELTEIKDPYLFVSGTLVFDNDELYSTVLDLDVNKYFFVSIDPQNGAVTKLTAIEGISTVESGATLNPEHKNYLFIGADGIGDKTHRFLVKIYYTKDRGTSTLTELNNTTYTSLIGPAFYSGQLFSYAWDPKASEEIFLSADPETGVVTKLASIPKIKWITMGAAFDPDKKVYYFLGKNDKDVSLLVKIQNKIER